MRRNFDLSFERQKTVLILSGTGTNAWHHYGFLKNFSLEDFNQFQAILGISGGACVFFVRIMEELGYFGDEGIKKYDSVWRRRLNRYGLVEKLLRARRGNYLFHTRDLHLAMRELFGQGMDLTFADFPVRNFKCVTHREDAGGDGIGDLYIADRTNSGPLPVGEVAASGGFPRRIGKMNLCESELVHGISISDFDFAPREIKSRFKDYLRESFADSQIVYLSLFKSGQKGNVHWIRTGRDRFPRMSQILDAALMATGIPNPRHEKVYRRSFP
jgi:hypothetical protein